ncbi:MAG: hypothetical protein AAGF89_17535 [Bacteroidota bacterium]
MRLIYLLLFSFFSFSIFAQQQSGWEISASFAPRFNKVVRLENVWFERELQDIPISQGNQIRNVEIEGFSRVFSTLNPFVSGVTPPETNTWFSTSLRLHRRFAQGVDLSVGVYYAQADYDLHGLELGFQQNGVVNTRSEVLFAVAEMAEQDIGLQLQMNYHLFAAKRIHPYFGFGASFLRSQKEFNDLKRVYSGAPESFIPLDPGVASSGTITQMNFDFMATAGISLRVGDVWSVGLEANTFTALGGGLVGVQLRRSL